MGEHPYRGKREGRKVKISGENWFSLIGCKGGGQGLWGKICVALYNCSIGQDRGVGRCFITCIHMGCWVSVQGPYKVKQGV